MKLITVFILLGCLRLSAESNAQTITLTARNYFLKDIFKSVQEQTGYNVIYNERFVENAKPVTISVIQMPLETFLTKVLSERSMVFSIRERTILIGMAKPVQPAVRPIQMIHLPPARTITGKVTVETGEPLAGVTVTVLGTSVAVATDQEGNYKVTAPDTATTLVFSFVGYETVRKPIGWKIRSN